jgi:hypothetical protein
MGIPKVGLTVIAGSPKVGKSLYATGTALAVGCRTLYIAEEGSRRGISYRLRHQAAALGVVDPPFYLSHLTRTRLDSPQSVRALREQVRALRAELVILDPLNKAHGADENKPTAMTLVMDALSTLAYDLGIAVVAIHHLAKPSLERRGDVWDRFRGASSIRSGTDANLVLDGSGDTVQLVGEFRDAEPLTAWYALDRETLLFAPVEGPHPAPAKVDPIALRAYVTERRLVAAADVMAKFDVSKMTAFAALRALGCDEFSGPRGRLTFSLSTAPPSTVQ